MMLSWSHGYGPGAAISNNILKPEDPAKQKQLEVARPLYIKRNMV